MVKKGVRTSVPYKLGFKSFYLYTAVSAKGENFTLIADSVNKDTMQIFLDEFAKTINRDVILVMDNAGWHKSLNVPDNVEIVFLPPYSPELNPVERLWKYIKDNILKNQIFESLNILENAVADFVRNLSKETISSICTCNYIAL